MKSTAYALMSAATAVLLPLCGPVCAAPVIFVEQPRVDVGVLYDDQKISHCFTVQNRGDSVLTLDRVTTCASGSCGSGSGKSDRPCKSYVLETNAIPPGGSASITFSFDMYMEKGAVSRPRTLHTNDPDNPTFDVELFGTVLPRYLKSPQMVCIPVADNNETISRTVDILCPTQTRKPLSVARSTNACFAAEVVPAWSTGAYEVFVKTVPPLPDGLTRGEVIVSSADSNDLPCVVRVLAYVRPAFCVMPESVLFQPVDESQLRIIFVRQNCAQPANLLGVTASSDDVSCEVSPGPGDGNYRIYVRAENLSGRKGGLGDIVITTDQPDWPEVRVPVEVKGVILASKPAGK